MAQPWNYAIIVDAGSSGSRVFAYRWRTPAAPNVIANVVPVPRPGANPEWPFVKNHNGCVNNAPCRPVPGADPIKAMAKIPAGDNDLGALPGRVDHHLWELLLVATDAIEAAAGGNGWQGRTTLFVGATGGMRSLSNNLVDVGKKARIEHEVRIFTHEYANERGLAAKFYATISGASEGQFGWAAVNYTQGANADVDPGIFTNAGNRVGYLEMGGQSMQVAFHSQQNPADNPRHFRRITIAGDVHNVFAREWKAHGIDATWNSHIKRWEDVLYPAAVLNPLVAPNPFAGPNPPVPGRFLDPNPLADNCMPWGAKKDNVGVAGTGNFYACMEEALWHVRCGFPCAELDRVPELCVSPAYANNAPDAAKRGCLIHNMPAHVQLNIHHNDMPIARWVGGSNFFYGAFGVFDNARRGLFINAPDGYQPLRLLGEAARLHANINADGFVQYAVRMLNDPYSDTQQFLWRAVFTAAYTTLIVRKGFGIEIPHAQEAPNDGLRNAVVQAANIVPPPGLLLLPAPNVLPDILNALSSAGGPNQKPYSTVDPDTKPWALGAAVLLACATAIEFPGGGAASAFGNLIG